MIKLVEFLCVDGCDDTKDFVILESIEVRKYNMTQDVVVETELKGRFSILERVNS